MKRTLRQAAFTMATLALTVSVAAAAPALPNFVPLAKSAGPAVVNISTEREVSTRMGGGFPGMPPGMERFFEEFGPFWGQPQGPRKQSSLGSGFIISSDGYIVTNNHVVEDASEVKVTLNDNRTFTAKVIGTDPTTDVALVKIDATDLPNIPFGESDALRLGEWVLAIGSPYGLQSTVTAGIISAKARNLDIIPSQFRIESFIQTDAAVNPGNSGGGLFDANGDLVGIINAKSSGDNVEGLGFAIPISNATDIIDELIANGEVTSRPTLGVSLYDVTDRNTAAQLGVDSTGVYIVQIVQGGSADRAGLQTGDRIISVDGTEVNSTEEVRAALNEHSTGEQMNMEIERDGNTIEVMVSL